ncbi:MAG: hypothetical protein CBD18_00625 [Opitutales bacterium TMED158]|nr:MAG: hypothetical protein CBD18_00625 [Opitutales bacterium TMED158]
MCAVGAKEDEQGQHDDRGTEDEPEFSCTGDEGGQCDLFTYPGKDQLVHKRLHEVSAQVTDEGENAAANEDPCDHGSIG